MKCQLVKGKVILLRHSSCIVAPQVIFPLDPLERAFVVPSGETIWTVSDGTVYFMCVTLSLVTQTVFFCRFYTPWVVGPVMRFLSPLDRCRLPTLEKTPTIPPTPTRVPSWSSSGPTQRSWNGYAGTARNTTPCTQASFWRTTSQVLQPTR